MTELERRDIYKRLQVGVIGLVSVLIFVSIANFIVGRAADEEPAIAATEGPTGPEQFASPEEETKKEPLAELGVTPAPENEAATDPAGAVPPATKNQIVPDLEPDPKLEKPMDRETR